MAFKIRQNAFLAGAVHRTLLGSSWRSPDLLVGWGQCDLSYGFLVKVTVKVSRYNIFQLSYSYS